MWLPQRRGTKRVGLLDFQDGVYGDAAYDLVSLLEDARRDVPPPLADAMLARYIAASGADQRSIPGGTMRCSARSATARSSAFFARLAARDGKFAYLNHLPRVWRHLEHDLAHPSLAKLRRWIDAHVPLEQRGVIRHMVAGA